MVQLDLSKAPPLVTLESFLDTYQIEDRRSESNVKYLEDKELLPLRYDSPLFPEISLLAAATFGTGTLHVGQSSSSPTIRISADEVTANAIEQGISRLGIGFITSPGSNAYRMSERDSAYSRLLSCLHPELLMQGTSASRKTKSAENVTLPRYVKEFGRSYERIKPREIARKVLQDHVSVLLQSRLYWDAPASINASIKLPARANPEISLEIAKDVIKMFSAVYPLLNLTEEDIRAYAGNNVSISLRAEHVLKAIQKYGLFGVQVTRSFRPIGTSSATKRFAAEVEK